MSTKIEWCDETINVVAGCTKVSPACLNCYAEKMAPRLHRMALPREDYRLAEKYGSTVLDGKWTGHVSRDLAEMDKALKWKKPKRLFIASMGDLFHDSVPDEFIARVWWIMGQCSGYLDPSRYRGHTFQILTKRPKRMQQWMLGWSDRDTRRRWVENFGEVYDWMNGPKYWPDALEGVWLGCTIWDQPSADENIPILLQIPAAKLFVSYEPALGPVDFTKHLPHETSKGPWPDAETDEAVGLDWVIMGGETGPGARPAKAEWFTDIISQCKAANVPVFVKKAPEVVPIIREFPESGS